MKHKIAAVVAATALAASVSACGKTSGHEQGQHQALVLSAPVSTGSPAGSAARDGNQLTTSATTPQTITDPVTQRPPALSGASVHDPFAFGQWRGKPVQVMETWNNEPSWALMEAIPSVRNFTSVPPSNTRFPGAMSFAQPMWAAGESAAVCDSGANDTHMRAIFTNLKKTWGPDAYVRLGWEMNGSWFPQNYAPTDPTGWVKCWQRWYTIIKGVSKGFQIVWNPSWSSYTHGHGSFDVRTVWPGNAYVDAAGPDYYDFKQNPDSIAASGEPNGINKWVEFVASKGKPLAVPEWALHTPDGGDNPAFIRSMSEVFRTVAASPTGLEYQTYFNLDGCTFDVHVNGCNPKAAAAYRQLF